LATKLASVTLEYGPLKFPTDLYGEKLNWQNEQYHYGVVNDPAAADFRDALLAIANGPFAFGIETLYVVGDVGIPEPTIEDEFNFEGDLSDG
jgi:hypothetical protein